MSKSFFRTIVFVSLLSLLTHMSQASSFMKDKIGLGNDNQYLEIKDSINFRGEKHRASALIMQAQTLDSQTRKSQIPFSNTEIFKYNSDTQKLKKLGDVKKILLSATMEIRQGNFVYSECYNLHDADSNLGPDNQVAAIIVDTKDQKHMHNLARKNLMRIVNNIK